MRNLPVNLVSALSSYPKTCFKPAAANTYERIFRDKTAEMKYGMFQLENSLFNTYEITQGVNVWTGLKHNTGAIAFYLNYQNLFLLLRRRRYQDYFLVAMKREIVAN